MQSYAATASFACPHCTTKCRFESVLDEREASCSDEGQDILLAYDNCPECNRLVVWIDRSSGAPKAPEVIYPRFPSLKIAPEIEEPYRTDLKEAILTIDVSPRASAALSRRLLELILTRELGIKRNTLFEMIGELMARSDVPPNIAKMVDIVRCVGIIAAHPKGYQNSDIIVGVERHEAELLVEIVDKMLEFAIVKPAQHKKGLEEFDRKAKTINKPPLRRS